MPEFKRVRLGKGWWGNKQLHRLAAQGYKIRYTDRYVRVRVRDPNDFEQGSLRTIDPGRKGYTKMIVGRLKGKKTTTVQAYLMERNPKGG